MDEYTRAIRQAQNILRAKAETFGDQEVGYHQWARDPRKGAYHNAADDLNVLLIGDNDEDTA